MFGVWAEENGSWTFNASDILDNDNDVDGTFTLTTVNSAQGTVTETSDNSGIYRFTPNEDYTGGSVTLTYVVTDNDGATASASATVAVTSVITGTASDDTLIGDIHELGDAGLHAKSHLEGIDSSGNFGISNRLKPHPI